MAEVYDLFTHGVTQSLLNAFLTCPMKTHWKFTEGLRPTPSGEIGALQFGDFFHQGLDAIYNSIEDLDQPKNVDRFIDIAVDTIHRQEKEKLFGTVTRPSMFEDLEVCVGQVRATLHCYFTHNRQDLAHFDWVDLEKVFEASYTLQDGRVIPLRGKYDGVFRDSKGKLWLFETKTKSDINDSSIVDMLNYNLQVMMYLYTMRTVYGEEPAGVVYNLIRRPQLRQKKTETLPEFIERIEDDVNMDPGKYFARYTSTVLPDDLNEWVAGDFSEIMERIGQWADGHGVFRCSASCYQYRRACEYMPLCAYGDRRTFTSREVIFPELSSTGDDDVIEV